MVRRRTRGRFVAGIAAAGLPAFRPHCAAAADAYTLRLSVSEAPNSVFALAAMHFAQSVNRRSGGRLTVEVFPNGQLLSEQDGVDGLTTGVLDLAVAATNFLVRLIPRFQAFDLPFLYKNLAAGFRVLDGPIGDEFLASLDAKGILGLTWGSGGFKEIETTSKAVLAPDDMKGLRIRCATSPVYIATYQALGAIPVPLDVNETYMALQQRVVDGLDINLQSFQTYGMFNVVRHVALANQFFSVNVLMASKRKIEALPADLQRIVREEGKSLTGYWRSLNERETASSIRFLKDHGVSFSEIQFAAFRKVMDPVYATFQAKLGTDLIDRIIRTVGA